MKYGNLVIEKREYVLLKRLINLAEFDTNRLLSDSLNKLIIKLDSARICDEIEMPFDVIRLNSIVSITSDKDFRNTFKLVLPINTDVQNNKISVITPMGAAVMGHALGDTVCWKFPSCAIKLTIEKVEQESAFLKPKLAS